MRARRDGEPGGGGRRDRRHLPRHTGGGRGGFHLALPVGHNRPTGDGNTRSGDVVGTYYTQPSAIDRVAPRAAPRPPRKKDGDEREVAPTCFSRGGKPSVGLSFANRRARVSFGESLLFTRRFTVRPSFSTRNASSRSKSHVSNTVRFYLFMGLLAFWGPPRVRSAPSEATR